MKYRYSMCRGARPRAPDGGNIVTNGRALGKRPYDVLHSFKDRHRRPLHSPFSILNSPFFYRIKKDGQWPSLISVYSASPYIRIAFSMIAHSRRFFSSSHEIL